jgi:hypothetical protein
VETILARFKVGSSAKRWTETRRCCMRLEPRKYLYDIKQAADLLGEFTAGKQFTDYQENSMLRAAVSSARRFQSFPRPIRR